MVTLAIAFTTPTQGSAVVAELTGRCQIAVREREIIFVTCPKAGEQKVLAAALAGTAISETDSYGTLEVSSTELVLVSARAAGSELDAELEKGSAARIPCTPGSYAIHGGYEYPVQVLRLVAR